MWAVTGWVIATWLRVTLVLGVFVVCWLALGTHPGSFWPRTPCPTRRPTRVATVR